MRRGGSSFAERSRRPAGDTRLHRALDTASLRFLEKRQRAFAEFGAGEARRHQARAIKEESLARLPELLEELERNLRSAAAHVFWAADAASARDYIVDLARRQQVKIAVKGKSMTTEEIALNPALEALGVEVVETDLGEYIVQLAGERPSHILTPAIHKSQEDIADLFHERLGVPRYEHAEELTRVARRVLREKFAQADIGITGANFAVAETGTLIVVENEGNGRLAMSMPPTHVVVMGIEKVIPRLADLEVFLQLLPRSATGQKLTSYVSWVTGPRGEAEDGPAELHVVILDNGRTRMLADPVLREALYCLRCGACLNTCPVYRKVGGHAYSSPYPGPIGAIVSPQLIGPPTSELPFASPLCGACREICPVKIDIPRLLLHLRSEAPAHVRGDLAARVMIKLWRLAVASQWTYETGARAARLAARLAARSRLAGRLLRPLGRWSEYRDLPPPAAEPFRSRWRRRCNGRAR